jgi:DNA-binding NarL/FixJ family response regulator
VTSDAVRVLIADDQALVRGGFRAILAADPGIEVVAEAGDGAEAVAAAATLQPDVAVIDVRMPVMDGIEATRLIIRSAQACRVLMLTTFDLDVHVYDASRFDLRAELRVDPRLLRLALRERVRIGNRAAEDDHQPDGQDHAADGGRRPAFRIRTRSEPAANPPASSRLGSRG